MNDDTKRKALVLLGLVTALMVMIAASLSQLELQPGLPLPKLEHDQEIVVAPQLESEPPEPIPLNRFFIVLVTLLAAGTILATVYRLLRGAVWRDIWAVIWPVATLSLLVCGFLYFLLSVPNSGTLVTIELPVTTPKAVVTSPLGAVPPVIFWLVGAGLLVSAGLAGIWIFGSVTNRTSTMELVELEAEQARQALKTGLDLKNVIISCYLQMSLALAQAQGIEREEFMTPREFEDLLVSAGIPHQPVHQLTQLFEMVRYGNWQPNPADNQKAIHCLEAIVWHSRAVRGLD